MKSKFYPVVLFSLVLFVFFNAWNFPSLGIESNQQELKISSAQDQDRKNLRKELVNILEMSIRWGGRDIHISKETWEESGFGDATGRDYNDYKDDAFRMKAVDELAWNESGAKDSTNKAFAFYSAYSARNRDLAESFPDVCKTPAAANPPVSIPYPNIAKSTDTKTVTKDTKVDVKADTIQPQNIIESGQKTPVSIAPIKYNRQQEIVRYRRAMKALLLRFK